MIPDGGLAMLHETQMRKEFWERLGATFSLSASGAFDVTYSGSMMFDSRAKRDLGKFATEHRRELQALVLADGDPFVIKRFESVVWAREHGRFTDELSEMQSA